MAIEWRVGKVRCATPRGVDPMCLSYFILYPSPFGIAPGIDEMKVEGKGRDEGRYDNLTPYLPYLAVNRSLYSE